MNSDSLIKRLEKSIEHLERTLYLVSDPVVEGELEDLVNDLDDLRSDMDILFDSVRQEMDKLK